MTTRSSGSTPGNEVRVISSAAGGSGPRTADREILSLAVPAFAALVAEPLFLLADSSIVGHLGTAALGGLGLAGQILGTVVYLCVFLAYGTTAAVARRIGAGDVAGAVRQGVDGLWLALAIGLVIIAVGGPLAHEVIAASGAPAAVAPQAGTYLRVSLFGVPGMLVVLAGTGVLRGMRDTRTPLLVSLGMFAGNLALNALFVYVFGWGIAGSAAGTAIAQTGGGAVFVAAVVRAARRHGVSLRPGSRGLRAVAAANADLLVRTLSLRVVLIVGAAIATPMGGTEIAAHQVAFQVWKVGVFAMDAIAIAGQAITGDRLGRADVAGARAITGRMVRWGAVGGSAFALVVLAARPWIPGLFTPDPGVRHLLLGTLVPVALMQPFAGVAFVLDGVLIGAGDLRYLAVSGVVAMTVFLPAAGLVYVLGGGLISLWLAIGLWMLVRFATLSLRARGDAWLVTGAERR